MMVHGVWVHFEGGVSLSIFWVVLQEVEDGGGNCGVDVTLERVERGGDLFFLLCFSHLLSLFILSLRHLCLPSSTWGGRVYGELGFNLV